MQLVFEVTKSYQENGLPFLVGIISSTRKDLQGDVFTIDALKSMANSAVGIPVSTTHKRSPLFFDDIGSVAKSYYDNQALYAEIALNPNDARAMNLFKAVSEQKVPLGFSVGGRGIVDNTHRQFGIRNTFVDFEFYHLACTNSPANLDCTFATAINKSVEDIANEENLGIITIEDITKAAEDNKPYGNVKYADPKNGKYPIDTEAHCRAAWSYINMPKNASKYSPEELSTIKSKIKAACKAHGIDISEDTKKELIMEPEVIEVTKVGAKHSAATLDVLGKIKAVAESHGDDTVKSLVDQLLTSNDEDIPDDADNGGETPSTPDPVVAAPGSADLTDDSEQAPTSDAPVVNVVVSKEEIETLIKEAIDKALIQVKADIEKSRQPKTPEVDVIKSYEAPVKTADRIALAMLKRLP